MKIAIRALSLTALFASLPLGAWAPPAAAATAPAAAQKNDEFESKFNAALRTKDVAKMGQLVRQYTEEAVYYTIETAQAIANAPNDTYYERMDGLREAWNTSMKTGFVEKIERYFSLLDPAIKRERQRVLDKYFKRRDSFADASREKDGPKLGVLALDFEEIAKAFETVGDVYHAANAWALMGQCYDEALRENDADLVRATVGFKACVKGRDEIELQDRLYKEVKQRYDWLKANGFDMEAAEEEAAAGGAVAAPVAKTITAPLTFEVFTDMEKVQRPNYTLDDFHSMWLALGLSAKGSTAEFYRAKGGPKVLRQGSSDVFIDTDSDGQGDVKIPLAGKLATVEFEVGEDGARRKWACQFLTGTDKDFYQDLQVNLQPTDEYMTIYYAPAASVVTTLGDTSVRIIDEDMDGVYGGPHAMWGNIGITEGKFQPEFDSVVIGSEKVAQPWSSKMKIGEQWYELETEGGGLALKATPIEVKTGTLKLKYKGGKPTYLIVKGSAKNETCFYDITAKGTEVPVGRYELYVGELRKGKKMQLVKALILPGETTPRWNVTAGETTEIELGAPYTFDFSFKTEGEDVLVKGKTVRVVGSAGERYDRPWGCVPRPEAAVRKAGSKRGTKPEKMGIVPNLTDGEYKYEDTWWPLDLTVPSKLKEGEEAEVQLFEKKNKLFGKIESDWKGN